MMDLNLKSIISKSISCLVKEKIILESRFGKVSFNFSQWLGLSATISFQRISGNGKILVNEEEVIVSSKMKMDKTIFIDSKTITIERPKDGIGETAILGIVLHMNEFEEGTLKKWKEALKKIEYKCIRISGEKLLAVQGAFINHEHHISKIETIPSNSYIRSDGKIKFQVPCEITELVVDTNLPDLKKTHDLFIPRNAPNSLTLPEEQKTITHIDRLSFYGRSKIKSDIMSANLVLYDSVASREFNISKFASSNKTVKAIRSNNTDYLLLRKGGSYGIVASFFRPNFEYIAVITAKKLNGNGRLQVEIPNGAPSNIIIGNDMEYYVSVKSSEHVNGKLTLSIPEAGTGEILISRIQIIEGIQLYSFRSRNNSDNMNQQSYEVAKTLSSLNVQYGITVEELVSDEIAKLSKTYARQKICYGIEGHNISVNGTIMSSTFSGVSWLNKIGPMFPTLTIQRSKKPGDLHAFIGDKNNLQVASKVWIEPFDSISSSQLEKLNKCNMVLSPSLSNVDYLSNHLSESVMVMQAAKPLPFISPQEVEYFKKMDYVVAFNRHPSSTKRIIDSWSDELPKLVLIGARGNYPSFVIPINEYFEYHKLLYVILNSKCIIDLPSNVDYASGMLDLVFASGLPVVTSNWYGVDRLNCEFILTNEKVEDFRVPSIDGLKNSVKEAVDRKRKDSNLDNYNENLNSFMTLLMS